MVHFTLYTLYSILYTRHSTLDTPPPRTLHCPLYNLHLALYTVRCTLYAPHSTLSVHTLHFKLYTFTLYTLHFNLDPHNFALSTLYAAWNLGLASCSCCARALTFCPQLPLFNCVTSSRASKGPLRCRRWTFESFPITCHYVGYADFLHPLRATVHTHMFSSSSPPTNIASIPTFGCSPYLHAPASDPLVHVHENSCAAALCPLCFHAKLPAKLAFALCPLGLKFIYRYIYRYIHIHVFLYMRIYAVDVHFMPVQTTWLMLALSDSLNSVSSYAIASNSCLGGQRCWPSSFRPQRLATGFYEFPVGAPRRSLSHPGLVRLCIRRWTERWGSDRPSRPRVLPKPLCKLC